MYKEYFGFSELPFSIAPDPRYLYMSEQHREALAHLVYGITTDGGFVMLTGEVGTGKTTVCRCLLEQAPADTDIAFILNPRLTVEELLASICDELRISYPAGATNKVLIDSINAYLLDAHGRGKKTVLIIEEAQNLGTELLEQVRLLTNLETNERKLMQIIMLGQPELRDLLDRPELRQLAQRITARYHLGPLSRKEVPAYVRHRLLVAGGREGLFPPSTLRMLWRRSSGIPRLVNLICDRALLGAFVQGKERVDRATLGKAALEVFGERAAVKRHMLGWIAAGLAFMAVAAVLAASLISGSLRLPRSASWRNGMAVHAEPETAYARLQRPAGMTAETTRRLALQELLRQWGMSDLEADKEKACSDIRQQGMRCLESLGSLEALRRLNRPAVLRLYDDSGVEYYAALTGLEGDSAMVWTAGEILRVDTKDLERQWFGEYMVVWKAPPDYEGDIRPGDRGPQVRWLSSRLAAVNGKEPLGEGRAVYDSELERQVKRFQQSAGLVPDGIVGPHTVIRLDAGAGPLLDGGRGSS